MLAIGAGGLFGAGGETHRDYEAWSRRWGDAGVGLVVRGGRGAGGGFGAGGRLDGCVRLDGCGGLDRCRRHWSGWLVGGVGWLPWWAESVFIWGWVGWDGGRVG